MVKLQRTKQPTIQTYWLIPVVSVGDCSKTHNPAASLLTLLPDEELDPYLENDILAAGIAVEGKAFFSQAGELGPDAVRRGFATALALPDGPTIEPAPPTVAEMPVSSAT